jgi:hypothetical protein
MAKGAKVWRPVMSAPNAKFPLPTCNGVEFELAFLLTFSDLTICDLRLHVISEREVPTSSKDRKRIFCIICTQLTLVGSCCFLCFWPSIRNHPQFLRESSMAFVLHTTPIILTGWLDSHGPKISPPPIALRHAGKDLQKLSGFASPRWKSWNQIWIHWRYWRKLTIEAIGIFGHALTGSEIISYCKPKQDERAGIGEASAETFGHLLMLIHFGGRWCTNEFTGMSSYRFRRIEEIFLYRLI